MKDGLNKRNDTNLAEGEVNGHAHRCVGDSVEVYGDGDKRIVTSPNGAVVTHEEHAAGELPPGELDIRIQRTVDPITERTRNVAD